MSELKFESLVPQEYSKLKTQFDDQSVIFVLKGANLPVVGYSGEFLFKQTKQQSILKYTDPTDKNQINPNDNPEMYTNTNTFRYYERVKDMIFKYGLKRELYKNSHGHWVDMTAIRKNMGSLLQLISGVIDESLSGTFDTSVYVKVADYLINHPEEGSIFNQYIVDVNEIPRATFIDENGKYWEIGPGDGTISVTEPKSYQFKRYLESENIDNIHTQDDKYILFTEALSDYETGFEASKNYEDNDAHKYDDLKLTFLHVDKTTPFTDLDNLLIFVNGLLVDYKKHPTLDNVIYLPNVKRLASLQQVGLKKGYGADQYKSYEIVGGDLDCVEYSFDNTQCKYSYKFNVEIYKFDNVAFSHFILPIAYKYILKTEAYSTNTYWLPYKLQFSDKINKDKSILICSGEIIPKDEWDIDPQDPHNVRLLYNDFEFEQLMNEMTAKMREYLAQTIQHDIENEPKVNDYITDYSTEESINTGFSNYVTAMNEYIVEVTGGLYDNHFALSAIASVIKQFDNRSYSLVTVDTDEDVNYDIQFYENHDDIVVDKPRINQLTNRNWSLDDILIVNGMKQQFVNVYQDKFKVPQTMWLMDQDNIFEHCSAYKLQVIKIEK